VIKWAMHRKAERPEVVFFLCEANISGIMDEVSLPKLLRELVDSLNKKITEEILKRYQEEIIAKINIDDLAKSIKTRVAINITENLVKKKDGESRS